MNRKEAKALRKEEKLQGKHRKVANGGKFRKWRNKRPFWGASLILLAGLMILYIPLHLYAIAFIPGSLVFVGFLFGGLILIMGILDYIYPQFSTVFGVVTIFLSILSVMGALGGFVIGTIIGIIGGAMSIAWEKQEVTITEVVPNKRQQDQDDVTNEIMEEKEVKTVQA